MLEKEWMTFLVSHKMWCYKITVKWRFSQRTNMLGQKGYRSGSGVGWIKSAIFPCAVLTESCPTLCDPQTAAAPRLLCPRNFSGKNTGVGCHFLLQGIFLTQGLNLRPLHLLDWQADSLSVRPLGFVYIQWVRWAEWILSGALAIEIWLRKVLWPHMFSPAGTHKYISLEFSEASVTADHSHHQQSLTLLGFSEPHH